MTVKLDYHEIYRETKSTVTRNEERSKNFPGDYPIGSVLRIDFTDGLRAAFEEVLINYKPVLC